MEKSNGHITFYTDDLDRMVEIYQLGDMAVRTFATNPIDGNGHRMGARELCPMWLLDSYMEQLGIGGND